MILCQFSLCFLLVIISIAIYQSYHLELLFDNNEYQHLPRTQGVLRFKLSCPVTIDRKSFKDIWIYKNGFVTLGNALEEESYPILTGTDKIRYQPFENLSGDNIIAVFITQNKNSFSSMLRVKEVFAKSIDGNNKETFRKLENLITAAYGQSVTKPMVSVLIVEWIDMEVEGTKGKKNSFRLYVVSSDIQSFMIVQYWNITAVSYKLFSESYKYQSGVRSYRNRHFILPFYDITDTNITLSMSSNTAIKNTWLVNLGDLSYYIDLGFPSQNSDDKIKLNRSRSAERSMMRSPSPYATLKKAYHNDVISTTTENYPKMTVGSKIIKSTKDKLVTSNNLSTRSQNTAFETADRQTNIPSRSSSKVESASETNSYDTVTYVRNIYSSTSPKDGAHNSFDTIFNKVTSTELPSKSINVKSGDRNNMVDKSRGSKKEISVTKLAINAKLFDEEFIETRNLALKNDINKATSSNKGDCQSSQCRHNEDCFISEGIPCCQCRSGSVHLGSQCARIDDRYKMRSSGSVSIQVDGKTIALDLSLATMTIEKYLSMHITLQSNKKIDPYLRSFILLLYPLFHIPMAFHASSWPGQRVPNLSSLIYNVAAMNIHIAVDGYGDLYATFKLDRTNADQWTIAIKESIDSKLVRALNLDGLKLDEKTTRPMHINYNLTNKNSADFAENSVTFFDEIKNRTINVKWRGSMTFTENCLSNYIGSRNYFVKFSETGYCNSDCIGTTNIHCRMMCMTTPYVFDYVPGPCQGNHCPNNMVCVDDRSRYDCKCPKGLVEDRDRCIVYTNSNDQRVSKKVEYKDVCSKCSNISSCRILNEQTCCICKTGYIGSGINCFLRDSSFELKGFGKLKVSRKRKLSIAPIDFRILFRQWHVQGAINYATYIDIQQLSYATNKQKNLTNLIFLLSPIFDIPMSLFARDHSSKNRTSIYAMSKGSFFITVNIGGISPTPISITFNVTEKNDSMDIKVHVKISIFAINPIILKDAPTLFEKRLIPDIKYRIRGRQLTLLPYSIQLSNITASNMMHVSGSGVLDECADNNDEDQMFLVSTEQPLHCKARCHEKYCEPYCQAIPQLNIISKFIECTPPCHEKAQCYDNACICQSGYSGDGLVCVSIKKTLECETDFDCNRRPFFECKNSTCLCKHGTVLRDNNCVVIDPCQKCSSNEVCTGGQCLCQPQFVRNRISQLCTFDCSLCDIYSTTCTPQRCACKDLLVYERDSNVTCTFKCQTENDCPTNEICDTLNKCVCPTKRIGGLCQINAGCNSCNINAVCINNRCTCLPDWIGDGSSCQFNCSLCFQPFFCDPKMGCSCPPEFSGDGKMCIENQCSKCPPHSRCENTDTGYRCQCAPGMISLGNQCIKDIVQIDILPAGPVSATLGNEVEMFCFGKSKMNNFKLSWLRKSGKTIKGNQNFVDATNKTLRLVMSTISSDDIDEYVCQASSGDYNSVMISTETNKCSMSCHKFATCVNGKCQCSSKYIGDGIYCAPVTNCSSVCSQNMICDESLGRCRCRVAFREVNSRCVPDCSQQDICDPNAKCDYVQGQCQCMKGFMGNGTKCWKQRINCILTKKCTNNSACVRVEEINQHACVCHNAYIGDGDTCVLKIDCDVQPCGSNSFCQPNKVQDHLGNLHKNGICLCEPGYKGVNDKCIDLRFSQKVLWMSIGEAVISLGVNENKSIIRHIDAASDTAHTGGIIAMTGDCVKRRLYWSGQSGVTLRSAMTDNMTTATTLYFGAGKIKGISVDEITGNVFFTDTYKGTITVIDRERNISQIIIQEHNYQPSQIVAHSLTGRLFWTVNDFLNPRIETSQMSGKDRQLFLGLNNKPISLTIVPNGENDSLCWIEVYDKSMGLNKTANSSSFGFLKCTSINGHNSQRVVRTLYHIRSDEPSSAFAYSDKFYWGVRKGKYIRTFDTSLSKIPINPNCCDVRIRGLVIMEDRCRKDGNVLNPCIAAIKNGCKNVCVTKMNLFRKIDFACLNGINL